LPRVPLKRSVRTGKLSRPTWERRLEVLIVRGMEVSYGEFLALRGISFAVEEGELVTIIGANGAGKSTILRAVMGLVKCRKGEILFRGENITVRPPHYRARLGISIVPEGRRIFPDLTVAENLLMGAYIQEDRHLIPGRMEEAFHLFQCLRGQGQVGKTLSGESSRCSPSHGPDVPTPGGLDGRGFSGVDANLCRETFRVIKNLHRQG
jgi:branched-chain amino acid transport system ATP-binding protein